MAIKNTVTDLQALFNASVNAAKSDDLLKQAFIKAGGNQDDPKRMLLAGRLAHSLNLTQEKAFIVLGKTGNPKHNPTVKDDVRSIIEEKAYGAARGFLSARLKAWGLVTASRQGGARQPLTQEVSTTKADDVFTKNVKTPVDMAAFLIAALRHCEGFAMKQPTDDKTNNLYLGIIKDALAAIGEISKKK